MPISQRCEIAFFLSQDRSRAFRTGVRLIVVSTKKVTSGVGDYQRYFVDHGKPSQHDQCRFQMRFKLIWGNSSSHSPRYTCSLSREGSEALSVCNSEVLALFKVRLLCNTGSAGVALKLAQLPLTALALDVAKSQMYLCVLFIFSCCVLCCTCSMLFGSMMLKCSV